MLFVVALAGGWCWPRETWERLDQRLVGTWGTRTGESWRFEADGRFFATDSPLPIPPSARWFVQDDRVVIGTSDSTTLGGEQFQIMKYEGASLVLRHPIVARDRSDWVEFTRLKQ
jgi:hypothetical protein